MPEDRSDASAAEPQLPASHSALLVFAIGSLEAQAGEHLRRWATEPRYRSEQPALFELLARLGPQAGAVERTEAAGAGQGGIAGVEPSGSSALSLAQREALAELADAFAGDLPIGTGGRRGPVGPGSNRMNSVVVRETALGLANALAELQTRRDAAARERPLVAIVYDTRAQSRAFAWLAAAQLAAVGVRVRLVDEPRSTPLLSFLVRHERCDAGLVISASHNPPGDNGMKIYGSDGAQVIGSRDAAVMREIKRAATLELVAVEVDPRAPQRVQEQLAQSAAGDPKVSPGSIEALSGPRLHSEVDQPYLDHVFAQGVAVGASPEESCKGLRIVFSALHGVGAASVVEVLARAGAEIVAVAQLPDDGKFATVRSANPELPAAFEVALGLARPLGATLVIACDPDADRLGAMVLHDGEYRFLDGNQLGVLMLDHVAEGLRRAHASDSSTDGAARAGFVATTLVTSPLIAKIARSVGLDVVDDLLVGFKHHAGLAAERGDTGLVFACEESHGYLRGDGVRDKDGAIAALLLSQLAARLDRDGKTLVHHLEGLWQQFGAHVETTANIVATGVAGRAAIAAVMASWRQQPPSSLGDWSLISHSDRQLPRHTGSTVRDLPGNVLEFEYELHGQADGTKSAQVAPHRCRLVLRPSGTEPKVKLYALASAPPGDEPRAAYDALASRTLALLDAARAAASAVMESA